MDFRVLGPMEIRDDGRILDLGTPAERHLLAVLICLANETVSVERLIDELWGTAPPATARNIIQQYVSHLRKSLRDDGQRLSTESTGYRLAIADDELDRISFELLASVGSEADDSHASAALREALALWRGPPFGGAGDGPTVSAERTRLEEARLTALENRIEADLRLGRHLELVAELEGLTKRSPLRERMWSHLMVALYRSGRQAEALRRYADYRSRLGEELGLEPSGRLVALEDAIFTRSPELDLEPEPAPTPLTNLPRRLTSFIGRSAETDAVHRGLLAHRLVTLVGAAGVGKTSLAIHAASTCEGFADGVWLVELAPLTDPGLVQQTVGSALGLPIGDGKSGGLSAVGVQTLARDLTGASLLIILDNCEHLVEAVAGFAETLLCSTDDLRILATSREPLGVGGEVVVRVPPLAVPEDSTAVADVVAAAEASALFVDRAQLVEPTFELSENTAPAVAEICRRLDGIPLAIELAAARLSTMTVHQIAVGLNDRFPMLTRGARTAPERHQTLEATVDWSHDLLGPMQRAVFRRCSVFRGGFDVEAAIEVCGDADSPEEAIPDALSSLLDRSMVTVDSRSLGGIRYRLLETFRAYGELRLAESGETEQIRERHARYFLELTEEAWCNRSGLDRSAWWKRLAEEHDNLRAALHHFQGIGDVDRLMQLSGALGWFWAECESQEEAMGWLHPLLGVEDGNPQLAARVYLAAAMVDDTPTRVTLAEQALSLFERAGDRAGQAETLKVLGWCELVGHVPLEQLHEWLDRAIDLYRQLGQKWGEAEATLGHAGVGVMGGDPSSVFDDCRRAEKLFAELGDDLGVGWALRMEATTLHHFAEVERAIPIQIEANRRLATHASPFDAAYGTFFLAEMLIDADRPDEAIPMFEEASVTFKRYLNHRLRVVCSCFVGLAHRAAERPDECRLSYEQALELSLRHDGPTAWVLECVAGLAAELGRRCTAATIFGAAERWREEMEAPMYWFDHFRYDPDVEMAQATCDPAEFHLTWQHGRTLSLGRAVELAQSRILSKPIAS